MLETPSTDHHTAPNTEAVATWNSLLLFLILSLLCNKNTRPVEQCAKIDLLLVSNLTLLSCVVVIWS